MDSSARIQRLPIYTAVLATIVVIPLLMDPVNLPKLWILCLGAGLSFAIFSSQILSLWKSASNRAILLVSLLFVSGLLISSAASQQDVFRTLVGVWGRNNGALAYLALLVIFLSLASMKSDDTSKYLIKALTLLGIFFTFYGWVQSIDADPINWENPGNKIILTLGNSDFSSSLFALTAIASLAMFLQSDLRMWKRAALAASFGFQTYLTHKSDALQGLLVLLFGSVILIGLWLANSNRTILKRLSIIWFGISFAIGVTGVFGLAGIGPFANFLNPNLSSLQDRFYHWLAALNMMKDNLIFGVGIDSFGDYYRNYRTIEGVNFRSTPMSGTNNAHNVLMQIGATGGLVLLIAYLALIIFTGYRAVVALRKSEDKILVSGIFSIWVAFQVQSLVSIDQIGLVIWGWASAGCLVSLSYINSWEGDPKNSKVKRQKITSLQKQKPKVILLLLGPLPAALLIPTIQNELILRSQLIALVSSESLETLKSNGLEVVRIASNSNEPQLRLIAKGYLLRAELTEEALALSIKNTSDFPNSFESWNATAEIYEKLGQKSKAIVYRKRTVELDPLNSEVKRLLEEDMASN
jgi:O-antigen ligase